MQAQAAAAGERRGDPAAAAGVGGVCVADAGAGVSVAGRQRRKTSAARAGGNPGVAAPCPRGRKPGKSEDWEASSRAIRGGRSHFFMRQSPRLQGPSVPASLREDLGSRIELDALLPIAKKSGWSVGIRCNTSEEFDPDNPNCPTQFGFSFDEAVSALRKLQQSGVRVETVHFHVRSYVEPHTVYERAIAEVAEI